MKTTLLQADYSRGSVQDVARHALPKTAVWKTVDYIPNLGAPLRKRGSWGYASPALGGTLAHGVAYAPFAGGSQLVAWGSNNQVYRVDSPESATYVGSTFWTGIQRPVFFNNLLISVSQTGSGGPVYYNGASIAGLGGSPPTGKYGVAYKSRLVLGNTNTNPNRIWFSDILDPQSWDLANSYIDMTFPVRGFAALRNALLVFEEGATERIRGDIPPPGGDMVREPLLNEGCLDARSIVSMGERVIWANDNGVWISDGAAADNLIKLGGLQQYWSNVLRGYDSDTTTISAGTHRGMYFISLFDAVTGINEFMVCDIESRTWSFHSNMEAMLFSESSGDTPEMYFAHMASPRIGKIEQIFNPGNTFQTDPNGIAVEPVIETLFYRGTPGKRRFKDLIINSSLAADPTTYLKVGYINEPQEVAYTTLTEDDGTTPRKILPKSTTNVDSFQRSRVPFRLSSDGMALKIEQVGPSTDTMLFDIEVTQHEQEKLL